MSGCSDGVITFSLVSQKNIIIAVTLVSVSFTPRVVTLPSFFKVPSYSGGTWYGSSLDSNETTAHHPLSIAVSSLGASSPF